MNDNSEEKEEKDLESLESLGEGDSQNLMREFTAFLLSNKKWWLTPVILAIVLLSVLVMVGGSSLAPLLYPFF